MVITDISNEVQIQLHPFKSVSGTLNAIANGEYDVTAYEKLNFQQRDPIVTIKTASQLNIDPVSFVEGGTTFNAFLTKERYDFLYLYYADSKTIDYESDAEAGSEGPIMAYESIIENGIYHGTNWEPINNGQNVIAFNFSHVEDGKGWIKASAFWNVPENTTIMHLGSDATAYTSYRLNSCVGLIYT